MMSDSAALYDLNFRCFILPGRDVTASFLWYLFTDQRGRSRSFTKGNRAPT